MGAHSRTLPQRYRWLRLGDNGEKCFQANTEVQAVLFVLDITPVEMETGAEAVKRLATKEKQAT